MGYIAHNVSAIVGSGVAAKLVGTAGGLSALANMPANVQFIGEQIEIFHTIPPPFRMRACRLLAAKCTLAVRVDSIRGDPSGKTGQSLKQEIYEKIEK
ncbi:U4/U6 small nuclear ribonucleoprotein Prp31-like isoform, partial [Trifolium medium]|nr:U4/U6 small nuclear ribonucleoprotein Prp31-like isoform [Trifolium medium]